MAGRLPSEPPRGMRDILPAEAELRDATAGTILGVYRRHGFRRIETPALESLELLTGGGGGENEKLIFKVLKRGEKLDLGAATTEADLADLGLRFDLTVPLGRYYAQNHAKLPEPLRAVQIGPGLARRAPPAGPVPPVHPVRHRHPRRRVRDRRDRADPGHHGGARRARARGADRADQRPPPPGRDGRLVRLRAGAPRERLHHARQVGQAPAGRDPPGAGAGRSSGGCHRSHAGALHGARPRAEPGGPAEPPGRPERGRRVPGAVAYRRGRGRRGGRPVPHRLRPDARAGHGLLHRADLRDPLVELRRRGRSPGVGDTTA